MTRPGHFRLSALQCLLALLPGVVLANDERGHCTPSESVVFSCVIGTKIVSVCGGVSKGEHRGQYLQYRFGQVGRPEIEILSSGRPEGSSADAMTYINPVGDGNGFIRFKRGAHSYIVFAFSSRETRPKMDSAPGWNNWHGVAIDQQDKIEKMLLCNPGTGVQSNFEPAFLAAHAAHVGRPVDWEAVHDRVEAGATNPRGRSER